jgi:hypothetical protein
MLDDFKIDGAQLRVEALRDLDVPQIKALERLHRLAVEHAGREDDKSIATACHEAVQAAWLAEPYPVRAALTRTGVAFALMGTYGGFSVEGINEFGSGLLAELHDVDVFDWEGTRIAPADGGASEQPSSEHASQPGRPKTVNRDEAVLGLPPFVVVRPCSTVIPTASVNAGRTVQTSVRRRGKRALWQPLQRVLASSEPPAAKYGNKSTTCR